MKYAIEALKKSITADHREHGIAKRQMASLEKMNRQELDSYKLLEEKVKTLDKVLEKKQKELDYLVDTREKKVKAARKSAEARRKKKEQESK